VIEQAMVSEHEPHAALRLAGRDAEHDILAPREHADRIRGARIQRLYRRAGVRIA
jgi:hypothetical protein